MSAKRPKIVISNKYDITDIGLYAVLLAHEAYHHKLHGDLVRLGGASFSRWKHYWFGEEIESYCREFERKVAIELGIMKKTSRLLLKDAIGFADEINKGSLDLERSFKTVLPYAQNNIVKNFTAAVHETVNSKSNR